jgi:16S rRNA (guanine527-N7)-methyltransferase
LPPGSRRYRAAVPIPRVEELPVLEQVLSEARHHGFLGPGEVRDQIARSLAFVSLPIDPPSGLAVDLGTGGGVPGLVLALAWPQSEWLFVESNQRRAEWLATALEKLALGPRAAVVCDRAEMVGRGQWRYQAELVSARSFAPPAATAECAAPLLRTGGHLLVADPPDGPGQRWPSAGLARLGLTLEASYTVSTPIGPASLSCMVSSSPCPLRYPRRVGVPEKRPLF